jgi:hypothetical protein
MELLKEDGTTPLSNEAAQDYINELEAQVKLLGRSKDKIVERLDEYQGEQGPYILFKDMLFKALDDDIMAIIKDDVLDGLPDIDELSERLGELEYENENKPDDYEVVDNVVDSMTFESRVEEIVNERLKEINFKVIVEED